MKFKRSTEKTFQRIEHYAKKTDVQFEQTPFSVKSLPDLRGFSPHRRTVHLPSKKTASSRLWVIHDLLHILFYDFARFHLGESAWKTFERFFENHLASEAFAVLVLDYHLLSEEARGGLAVDIEPRQWEKFQKLNPHLPEYKSSAFSKVLLDLYLKDEWEIFKLPPGKRSSRLYSLWLGHEVRYSQKQRRYVQLWWEDLHGKKRKNEEAQTIQRSEVHHAVWELISLLLFSSDRDWKKYVEAIEFTENAFSFFPKFSKKTKNFDFRFTRMTALKKMEVSDILQKAKSPNASHLFLFWQILSLVPKFNASQLLHIQKLARAAQKGKISKKIWEKNRILCQDILEALNWEKIPEAVGDFFLP